MKNTKKGKKTLSIKKLIAARKARKEERGRCAYCTYLKMYYPEVRPEGLKEACYVCSPAKDMKYSTESTDARALRLDRELIDSTNNYRNTFKLGPILPKTENNPVIAEQQPAFKPVSGQQEHATGRRLTVKKPGVITRIIELLRGASKKKPITKDAILEDLVKTFPDRESKAMRNTISSQIPSCLKTEKDLTCKTDGKGGWWLPKE